MKTRIDVAKGWLLKADGDLSVASLCLDSHRAFDSACFHAQQAAEKFLKAYLICYGIRFPFVHDLDQLIDLCATRDPTFQELLPIGDMLTPYAVELRYDVDFSPELGIARDAYDKAIEFRTFVMARLPPEVNEDSST